LHRQLQQLGFMEMLDYSESEYAVIQEWIDHERDFEYAHYQLHTHLTKYAIADRVKGIYYESPQFIYMRMAMALSVDQPRERRMRDVQRFYEHLSKNRINAPTPNHVNLGTPLRGYASCCLYTVGDNARSIAVGNHIANTMTYMSAGIGAHINTRSINDPVRGGVIRHQGKLPYYRALVAEVKSNLQNGRGGACTTYFPIFDPEMDTLLRLKNPMSTEDKKIRGMDYSWGGNRFFARKVARNEDIFLFNVFTAPDLQAALYSGDEAKFEEIYERYAADENFPKTWVSARELLITASNEWNETGRVYEHNISEMNRHTPFKDTIYSSNLCAEIAERLRCLPVDMAYTFGLFHDCGIPLLMRRFPQTKSVLMQANAAEDGKFTQVEDRLLGTNHAVVGYFLARRWRLPDDVAQAILHHHDYGILLRSGEVSALTQAQIAVNVLAEHAIRLHVQGENENEWPKAAAAVCGFLGLSLGGVDDLIEDLRDYIH